MIRAEADLAKTCPSCGRPLDGDTPCPACSSVAYPRESRSEGPRPGLVRASLMASIGLGVASIVATLAVFDVIPTPDYGDNYGKVEALAFTLACLAVVALYVYANSRKPK